MPSPHRVQVVMTPLEHRIVDALARQDRRSKSSMSAVLIREAVRRRIELGQFALEDQKTKPHPLFES